jgi:HPC2 and ubinuclein domain
LTAGAGSTNGTTTPGANIWLTFPLKGQHNVTINFAREVERKYGFAALHPRLEARKQRQRQLALAAGELEKAQGLSHGDDMSVDLSEPDSNVEMGGTSDAPDSNVGTNGEQPKKRRKRRQEDYDRNDDFIDDTEMAWEEQALMAKDGFFVYSGPLVAEGEKPAIERYVSLIRCSFSYNANI